MKLLRYAAVILLGMLVCENALSGAQMAGRDSEAISVLRQAVASSGGTASSSRFLDFEATGKVSYYWAASEVSGNVVVRGRFPTQYRVEASLPNGRRVWAVSNNEGFLKDVDGSERPIPTANAQGLGGLAFPLALLTAALGDNSYAITYVGVESRDSGTVHHIRLRRTFADDTESLMAQLSERDLFIDTRTLLLVSLRLRFQSVGGGNQVFPIEYQFSDFRTVGGRNLPFTIRETANGQDISLIKFSEIRLNVGLSDADFAE